MVGNVYIHTHICVHASLSAHKYIHICRYTHIYMWMPIHIQCFLKLTLFLLADTRYFNIHILSLVFISIIRVYRKQRIRTEIIWLYWKILTNWNNSVRQKKTTDLPKQVHSYEPFSLIWIQIYSDSLHSKLQT